MKKIWNSFVVAFAMYSKIPMPKADWSKENMKYALCFFPVVGLAVGAVQCLWFWFASWLGIGSIFRAAVITVIPVIVTGGIHVDGYLDTMDALSSWRDREKRLAILKDPHAGAFSVLMGCIYFIAYFGAATELTVEILPVYCLSFALARSLSGLSILYFANANPNGTAAAFADQAQKRTVTWALLGILASVCLAVILLCHLPGLLCTAAAFFVFLFYYVKSNKYFGGITGDLAGYFVCLCELFMLITAILVRYGMEKLL